MFNVCFIPFRLACNSDTHAVPVIKQKQLLLKLLLRTALYSCRLGICRVLTSRVPQQNVIALIKLHVQYNPNNAKNLLRLAILAVHFMTADTQLLALNQNSSK